MMLSNHKPNGNNSWGTPWKIFKPWDKKFNFLLDVCADETNAKCAYFYDEKSNGLDQLWTERNWCNPPYGRGLISPWCQKATEEAKKGNLTTMLLPVATSTRWWNDYVTQADHIYYYPYRINFLREGKEVRGVSFDSCVAIFGLNPVLER